MFFSGAALSKRPRANAALQATFYGVRGSIACGGADYTRFGGNTSCVAVSSGSSLLIVDAGTGLRVLGDALKSSGLKHINILLSHTHFDHVCGFPFFAPAYDPAVSLTVWSGHLGGQAGATRAVMERLMEAPLFPVDPNIFKARVEYRDFEPGAALDVLPDMAVRTAALHHPNGATGYRISVGQRAIVYASDHEHGDATHDGALEAFARDSDLLIYDATYSDATYLAHRGWGHSTWQEGVRMAARARVKTLALFHHDPAHTDSVLLPIERQAASLGRAQGVRVFAAREGYSWSC
jgi:phosphoribosyl 1,2-cyclic phosphodiesterase